MSREWGHLCVKLRFFTEIKLVFNREVESQPLCPRPPAIPLSSRGVRCFKDSGSCPCALL